MPDALAEGRKLLAAYDRYETETSFAIAMWFLEHGEALLDIAVEAKWHVCPLVGGAPYRRSPHLEQADEGTAYCRMCARLAALGDA